MPTRLQDANREISIHALREEGDGKKMHYVRLKIIYFYPRPPQGGRPAHSCTEEGKTIFLSTPSARRATKRDAISFRFIEFLSTPSARRATVPSARMSMPESDFYPRPPRGGRPIRVPPLAPAVNFYPRPPRGGRG